MSHKRTFHRSETVQITGVPFTMHTFMDKNGAEYVRVAGIPAVYDQELVRTVIDFTADRLEHTSPNCKNENIRKMRFSTLIGTPDAAENKHATDVYISSGELDNYQLYAAVKAFLHTLNFRNPAFNEAYQTQQRSPYTSFLQRKENMPFATWQSYRHPHADVAHAIGNALESALNLKKNGTGEPWLSENEQRHAQEMIHVIMSQPSNLTRLRRTVQHRLNYYKNLMESWDHGEVTERNKAQWSEHALTRISQKMQAIVPELARDENANILKAFELELSEMLIKTLTQPLAEKSASRG